MRCCLTICPRGRSWTMPMRMRIWWGSANAPGAPRRNRTMSAQLLVDYAQAGAHVVRLKSGDSGVFGRLEEELAALRAASIKYEIIPGVTAASAAAAAAGIPLTRRLTARRLQFITGHDVTGGLPDHMNLAALADPQATTVVYMGKRTFAAMLALLLGEGLPQDTPALVALGVSTPAQRLHRTTVQALPELLERIDSAAPVLILYGPLADEDAPA